MYLHALANTVPKHAYTQSECWQLFQNSWASGTVKERSVHILEKVLTGDSGIGKRHFATENVAGLFERDAEVLNHDYEQQAPKLAGRALAQALADAGLKASELDALIICTCTGYLCPGLSSYVAEQLGLRADAYLQDLVGLGCGAAIPALRSASHLVASDKSQRVAVVAVEVCSAAFFLNDDPGVLISLCLFGDGASASIWNGHPGPTGYRATGFDTLHRPEERELLRFVNSGGKLRNKLHKSVPERAADAVCALFERQRSGPEPYVISHAGGRDVLEAIAERLPGQSLKEASAVLLEFGNMSSPSVLFALEKHLQRAEPSERLWLTSFGAGFAAHSMSLER